jgi:two-component system OmpR family sensor kinase
MRALSIRWRLTLFHAVTMAAIMAVLILAMFAVIGYLQQGRLEDRVSDCAWIGESSLRSTGTLDPGYLAALGCNGVTLVALDAEGHILDQTGGYAGALDSVYPGDIWERVLANSEQVSDRNERIEGTGGTRASHAIPVAIDDPPARVVVASLSYGDTGSDTIYLVPVIIAAVAIVALAVIVTASSLLVRSSLAPVAAITDAAREITASDLSRRLPVTSRDELGRLSRTINDLLARLETAFGERERALAEQRRFVADASHELRTPLTSILGYTRMLRQWGLDDPATARESAAALEQEAERMHRLIEALLRLARGDEAPALSLDEQDLRGVVEEAATAARAFAELAPDVRVDLPQTPLRAMADREMLVQVVEILLDNAIKYAGGAPIEVALAARDDRAEIRVIDHGSGIAPEYLPHLFERFYRGERARTTRGSGLGLAIAKQIVEQHDGTIAAASVPGAGATFTITLPRLREVSRPSPIVVHATGR